MRIMRLSSGWFLLHPGRLAGVPRQAFNALSARRRMLMATPPSTVPRRRPIPGYNEFEMDVEPHEDSSRTLSVIWLIYAILWVFSSCSRTFLGSVREQPSISLDRSPVAEHRHQSRLQQTRRRQTNWSVDDVVLFAVCVIHAFVELCVVWSTHPHFHPWGAAGSVRTPLAPPPVPTVTGMSKRWCRSSRSRELTQSQTPQSVLRSWRKSGRRVFHPSGQSGAIDTCISRARATNHNCPGVGGGSGETYNIPIGGVSTVAAVAIGCGLTCGSQEFPMQPRFDQASSRLDHIGIGRGDSATRDLT